MRTWSLLLLGIAACGPIYPDQQPARPKAEGPPQAGPPGGGADPWAAEPAGPAAEPDDPYAPAPDDPYVAQAPGGRGGASPGKAPAPAPARPAEPAKPAAPAKPAEPAKPPPGKAGAPALSADAQALLDEHNRVRAQHCAPALTWSPKLAEVAQQWAKSLKDQGCKFGHSGGRYGENLAAGTAGTLDGKSVTAMWYDEIAQYSFKSGGFSMQTGHFTQVVWKETTQLGCAVTSCRGMDIWVCEYDPPGNVQGMYRQNVLPKGCR
ncbi:MAG TPA: CAP domain-containing protein [Kofleriaceae bacterium]|nr:CAP domain-containing protein [Kofleriaceae bacterium]